MMLKRGFRAGLAGAQRLLAVFCGINGRDLGKRGGGSTLRPSRPQSRRAVRATPVLSFPSVTTKASLPTRIRQNRARTKWDWGVVAGPRGS